MQVPHPLLLLPALCDMCRLEAPQRSAAAAAASAAAGLLSAVMNYSAVSDMVSCWVLLLLWFFSRGLVAFWFGSKSLTVLQTQTWPWLLPPPLGGKPNLSHAGCCHLSTRTPLPLPCV